MRNQNPTEVDFECLARPEPVEGQISAQVHPEWETHQPLDNTRFKTTEVSF